MTIRTAEERVLSTLNQDGSRRWLRPTVAPGYYWSRRRLVGCLLIALFVTLPRMTVDGRQAVLFDLARRELSLFGATLYATDTLLLMLFLIGLFLGVFLLTALYGRVWCGWGCPQTVYLEFVFRPLERLIEGKPKQQRAIDAQAVPWRRLVKWAVFLAISFTLSNVFLAYFVPVDTVLQWATRPPTEHPHGFAVVAVVTLLMMIDFAWFREQMCVVACPYARLQSVLIDKQSLIIAYDAGRGEPRGKLRKATELRIGAEPAKGDCVDCGACVRTCPTGLDIRDGFQLECIACAQCADACDAVMAKVAKPAGLIRYTSQAALERVGASQPAVSKLRARTILYPVAICIVAGLLAWAIAGRGTAEVTLVRGIGAPYTVQAAGEVTNLMRLRIDNHSGADRLYHIAIAGEAALKLVAPRNPLPVAKGGTETQNLFLVAPAGLVRGKRQIQVRVDDRAGYDKLHSFTVLGPN